MTSHDNDDAHDERHEPELTPGMIEQLDEDLKDVKKLIAQQPMQETDMEAIRRRVTRRGWKGLVGAVSTMAGIVMIAGLVLDRWSDEVFRVNLGGILALVTGVGLVIIGYALVWKGMQEAEESGGSWLLDAPVSVAGKAPARGRLKMILSRLLTGIPPRETPEIDNLPREEQKRLRCTAWNRARRHPVLLFGTLVTLVVLVTLPFTMQLINAMHPAIMCILGVSTIGLLLGGIWWQDKLFRRYLQAMLLEEGLCPKACLGCGHGLEGFTGHKCPACGTTVVCFQEGTALPAVEVPKPDRR